MKYIAGLLALGSLVLLPVVPAMARDPWHGYPSDSQVSSAVVNTRFRTTSKCWSEQLVDDRGVKQAVCWKPQVNFCFKHRRPRAVFCHAMFHRVWVDRFHHGRVDTFSKMFQWRVRRPVFGFLFARERPVNPWFYLQGI